jgi:hypothetical protein
MNAFLSIFLLVCLVFTIYSPAYPALTARGIDKNIVIQSSSNSATAFTMVSAANDSTASKGQSPAFTPHRIAWGLSGSISDVSMLVVSALGIIPAPMLSTLYEYHFSEHYALQTSLHFLHSSAVEDGLPPTVLPSPTGFRMVTNRSETTAHAVTMDITLLAAPFAGNEIFGSTAYALRTLRVGGGMSLRSGGRLTLSNDQKREREIFTHQVALGINAALEYGIPLDDRIEIAAQARAQMFFSPIATKGDQEVIGFAASQGTIFPKHGGMLALGLLLRIHL